MQTLSGLLTPRGGSITFGGKLVTAKSSYEMVNLGIVQVPQGREVFANMSVRDNLELGGASIKNRRQISDDIEKMFSMFPRLKERSRERAGSLSGGEQQIPTNEQHPTCT